MLAMLHLTRDAKKIGLRFDTNQTVQSQKQARSLKFRIYKDEELYYVAKSKALVSCAVIAHAQLICAFDFAKVKICFSHYVVHFICMSMFNYKAKLSLNRSKRLHNS